MDAGEFLMTIMSDVSSCKKNIKIAECHISNKAWTVKYLFTEVKEKAESLVCSVQVAVFKD